MYYLGFSYYPQNNIQKIGLNVGPYYPELFCNNPKNTYINICMYVCMYVCIHISILFGASFFIYKFEKSLFCIFNIKLSTQRISPSANNNYNAHPITLDFTTQP